MLQGSPIRWCKSQATVACFQANTQCHGVYAVDPEAPIRREGQRGSLREDQGGREELKFGGTGCVTSYPLFLNTPFSFGCTSTWHMSEETHRRPTWAAYQRVSFTYLQDVQVHHHHNMLHTWQGIGMDSHRERNSKACIACAGSLGWTAGVWGRQGEGGEEAGDILGGEAFPELGECFCG